MNLLEHLPQHNHVLGIAERVKSKFPSSKGQCEFMAVELEKYLTSAGIQCHHVMGNFHLDDPGAYEWMCPEDEENSDEYVVSHDWITVEGRILDISADQFCQYINEDIPNVVFISYTDPLYNHYEELGYVR